MMPYAVKTKEDTANYYWFYKASVKASFEDLEITEFGSYLWDGLKWVFGNVTGKPFEPKRILRLVFMQKMEFEKRCRVQ